MLGLVLAAATAAGAGCGGSGQRTAAHAFPPVPVVVGEHTLSLHGLATSRNINFSDRTARTGLHLRFVLAQPAEADRTPSTHPELVLTAAEDDQGTPLPNILNTDRAPSNDLRRLMYLIETDAGRTQPNVWLTGVLELPDPPPAMLGRVSGEVRFDRVGRTRVLDLELNQIADSVEVTPGLWLKTSSRTLRPSEFRFVAECVVALPRADVRDSGPLPPIPVSLELLDQHGHAIGQLQPTGSEAGTARYRASMEATVRLPKEREARKVRVRIAETVERVVIPFEFVGVPLDLPASPRGRQDLNPACPG